MRSELPSPEGLEEAESGGRPSLHRGPPSVQPQLSVARTRKRNGREPRPILESQESPGI
jgi:hypothetical protein